jgi:UDP-glucose 4-epimerase
MKSKYMVELLLEDYEKAYGLRSICLRYFNAAGADSDSELGEMHSPETLLIPLILQVASGRRESISIFGNDSDTPDGSCVRDYIHIEDICTAHKLSLDMLLEGSKSKRYNLGNGIGFSVIDVINTVKRITEKKILTIDAGKRPGDPGVLIADSLLAKTELNWVPKHDDLDQIVKHAWKWEQKLLSH